MVNPYQAPDRATQPERSIHVVKMRTLAEIWLIWGMLFVVLGSTMYLANPTLKVLLLAALIFGVGGAGHWFYWRRREDRIRARQPLDFAGKAALWGGLARAVSGWWSLKPGYLFLTVDSLVFVRLLTGDDRGEFSIPLDEITALKSGRGKLIIWWGAACRQVFRMYGCGEWRTLIEMACRVRAQRRRGNGEATAAGTLREVTDLKHSPP